MPSANRQKVISNLVTQPDTHTQTHEVYMFQKFLVSFIILGCGKRPYIWYVPKMTFDIVLPQFLFLVLNE